MAVAMAETYEIVIDGWRPASLNELLGMHHMAAGRRKKLDRDHVILFGGMAHVPEPTGKRRVSLRMTIPKGQRRWDIDALQKSTLDACVHAKLIKDDNEIYAEWGGVEYTRGEAFSTTIIIKEVEQE